MIDLEGLERALTQVEGLMELFEDSSQPGPVLQEQMGPIYARMVEEIKQGLWERFLEARETKPTAAAWTIRVRFEAV